MKLERWETLGEGPREAFSLRGVWTGVLTVEDTAVLLVERFVGRWFCDVLVLATELIGRGELCWAAMGE